MGLTDVVTIWNDGSWKRWRAEDDLSARNDPNYLATIQVSEIISDADVLPKITPTERVVLTRRIYGPVTADRINEIQRAIAHDTEFVDEQIMRCQIIAGHHGIVDTQ